MSSSGSPDTLGISSAELFLLELCIGITIMSSNTTMIKNIIVIIKSSSMFLTRLKES